jgi:hypothetical protein
MSFDVKGPYTPPVVPKKAMSPWAIAGLGCGALTLLVFGGITVTIFAAKNKIEAAMKEPIDKNATLRGLGDVPIDKDAEFDETITKIGKAGIGMFSSMIPAKSVTFAGFRTSGSPADVNLFYEKTLIEKGYSAKGESGQPGATMYQKGDEGIQIIAQRSKKDEGPNQIIIVRFVGLKQK